MKNTEKHCVHVYTAFTKSFSSAVISPSVSTSALWLYLTHGRSKRRGAFWLLTGSVCNALRGHLCGYLPSVPDGDGAEASLSTLIASCQLFEPMPPCSVSRCPQHSGEALCKHLQSCLVIFPQSPLKTLLLPHCLHEFA